MPFPHFTRTIRCFLSLLVGLCALHVSAQRLSLNTGWEFQRLDAVQPDATKRAQGSDWASQFHIEHIQTASHRLAVPTDTLRREADQLAQGAWSPATLPHTPSIEPLAVKRQWQGVCYYRRNLRLTSELTGKRLWLEFEGAMQLADLWVNGRHVAQHAGGYTPFVADVTDWLKANADNEIVVRLDNRDNPLIPPGKPLADLDFCYYGGLYRNARLIAKPAVHITHPILADQPAGGGVFVTYPRVSADEATIRIQTEVANQSDSPRQLSLRQTLYEWSRKKGKGRRVITCEQPIALASGTSVTQRQTLTVSQPRLWSPASPALYLLITEVRDGRHTVDREETRIGIRRIEFSRERGFLINGEPLRLVGTNRHMEYPYVGNALPDAAQFRDIHQIRSNGFNIVRLGHYPQAPAVLDACDELGLLAIEPIPGWQFYNGDTAFTQRTYRDVRDMIRRDRNHPSVVLWETTLNESWPPDTWKDGAVRTAHEEYPGDQCYTSGDAYGYSGFDVCYNDWEEGFNRPNKTDKAGFIREYYDYEFGGHYSTTRIRRADGDRALMQNAWNAQWSHNRYNAYYPHTAGNAVWSMYDYNRGCSDLTCYSGVANLFRLPKFSLPFFRSQTAAGSPLPDGPMPYELFIASHWMSDSPDTLQVYGNVDEVELRLNGRTIAREKADDGPDTPYVPGPDGGNCRQLRFPPFTFTGIPRETGELTAVGYVKGHRVTTTSVHTPGQPDRLVLSYFESGRPAEKHDLLIVYVRLTDERSTTLSGENDRKVTLCVENGGTVIGPSTTRCEAGVASFLVQTSESRRLRLRTQSGNLTARKTLRLRDHTTK